MADCAPGFETLRRICAAALRGQTESIGPDADFGAQGLALAERHRVVPVLAAGLAAAEEGPGAFAGGLRDALRRRTLSLAQQMVRLEQELVAIAARLGEAQVDFLLLKGPALARQAYPVQEWRTCDDLDLWVGVHDFGAALRALEAAGYRRSPPADARVAACARRAGIEVGLVHPDHGRLVELSFGPRRLAPTRRAAREVMDAAVAIDVAGRSVRVPAPVHALLLACAHGAHHRWDRLIWVADVAGLWLRLSPEEREGACVIARRWRIETLLGIGLRLARDHFDAAMQGRPEALVARARAEALAGSVRLEAMGFETLRARIRDRWRFECMAQDVAWRRWRLTASGLFTPTLVDIQSRPLPAILYPLYAVLRPLRLRRLFMPHYRPPPPERT